jgi:hypothetical protein
VGDEGPFSITADLSAEKAKRDSSSLRSSE